MAMAMRFLLALREGPEKGEEKKQVVLHARDKQGAGKIGSLPVLKRLAHIPADLDFGRKLAMSTWFMPYGSLALR